MLALACALAAVTAQAQPQPQPQPQPLAQLGQVYQALKAGRYAEVEAFYARVRAERARLAGGEFVFEEFAYNVYWLSVDDPADPAYWPRIDAATKAWITHSPRSHLAAMTRAFVLAYRGEVLHARRGNWKEIDALVAEARRLMEGTRKEGEKDALWNAIRLRVAASEALPRAELVKLVEASVSADPQPLRVWKEAAVAMRSGSRGHADDLQWLMRLAERHTAREQGASMGARLLAEIYWAFPDFLASPFGRTGPRWDEVHRGFLDWKKRYPTSYQPNLHGALACAAGDRAVTAALLVAIGNGGDGQTWDRFGGRDGFARCKQWALGTAPGSKT
ncbi:MAG TPA: hypothetical protein VIL30_18685 [Ramlibacter sp.]